MTSKKNSIAYTISNDSESNDSDDFDDHNDRRQSFKGKKKNNSRSNMMNPMSQMNSLMNSMLHDPFGVFGGFQGMPRRTGGYGNELMPFGFSNINDIFSNFDMSSNDPNCHSFSSSTVMTMSSGPDGRPQVYQASQSMRRAPGGICETQKSVCDSRTGTKKMAIGHHIGQRSHIMEREQNMHSGQQEERQEFINLDEDEADEFNREWEARARSGMSAIGGGGSGRRGLIGRRQRDDIPAILDRYRPRSRYTSRRRYYPAITSVSSSESKLVKRKKRSQENDNCLDDDDDDGGDEDVENTRRKSSKQRKSSHSKKA